MNDKNTTTLDLMRHGEPVGGRRYRGQVDDPLTEKGWDQMRRAVGEDGPWQLIVSSPLRRCAEFARELADRRSLPLELDPRLVELGFGAWEGLTAQELTALDPDLILRFRLNPLAHAPPGAEPLTAFRDRVLAAWNDLINHHRGKHILVIAHAGVIRLMMAHVLDIPLENLFRIQVSNAGISRLRIEQVGDMPLMQLLFHGGHL